MVSGTGWPGGDPFLQRQNEPSVAFSTRNPAHLLAGANDYRTVDLPFPSVNPDDEEYSGDAWLGLFKSFDGGQTWQSTLVPGYPQDVSPEGIAFKGTVGAFGAAADPVVRAGTSGLFYYAGIAFQRPLSGNPSNGALFLARFIDLNNKENGDATLSKDPIRFLGAVPVVYTSASGFVDKPAMAVDAPRGGSTCTLSVPQGTGFVAQTIPAGNVYVAYSSITGTGAGLQATVYFTRSTDCGATWSAPIPLSTPSQQVSQGAAIAVDPVSGAAYVAWRQFASGPQANAINVVKLTNGGTTVGPITPVVTLPSFDFGNPTAATLFDQGTTGGSFRTNAYPSLAVDGSGRVYLVWAQRQPLLFGDARVMVASSIDGLSWSIPSYVDNGAVVDDTGHLFPRGHQFMPQINFSGGRLTVLYYDMRLDHTLGLFSPVASFPNPDALGRFELETRGPCGSVPPSACAGESPSLVFTPFLTDDGLNLRRHTADLRIAQSGPGAAPAFTTTRVSQYKFGTRGDESTDITYLQQLQVNPPNLPLFQLGTVPFLGDYIDVAGLSFVQPTPGGPWTFNTAVSKVGAQFAVWTSNQDVIPPYDPSTGIVDWTQYTPPRSALNAGNGGNSSLFDSSQTVPACGSPFTGSRNQNIYGALVTQDFQFSSPQNTKPLSTTLQRAFVVVAQNMTGFDKAFRLTIGNQPAGGWASFTAGSNVPLAAPAPVVATLDLAVAAHSSASRSIFATSSSATAPITVNIAETSGVGGPLVVNGLSSFVVLNGDASAPGLVPPDDVPDAATINTVEVYMPNVTNPNPPNPNVTNPNVTNPNVTNPNVTNSDLVNPNVTNLDQSNPNVTNSNATNADIANLNVATPNVTNPNVTNAELTNPNVTNLDPSNPNVTNPNVTNADPSDAVYTLTNTGNTAAAYQVKLVGNAARGRDDPAHHHEDLQDAGGAELPALRAGPRAAAGQHLESGVHAGVREPERPHDSQPGHWKPDGRLEAQRVGDGHAARLHGYEDTRDDREHGRARRRSPGCQHEQPDQHAVRSGCGRDDDPAGHCADPDRFSSRRSPRRALLGEPDRDGNRRAAGLVRVRRQSSRRPLHQWLKRSDHGLADARRDLRVHAPGHRRGSDGDTRLHRSHRGGDDRAGRGAFGRNRRRPVRREPLGRGRPGADRVEPRLGGSPRRSDAGRGRRHHGSSAGGGNE